MKTIILSLITILFLCSAANSQNASIHGIVTDENNNPLFGINVAIEGTTYGDATNEKGEFTIVNVPEGEYKLIAHGISFETSRKAIRLEDGQNFKIDFALIEAAQSLQEVEIVGRMETSYKNNMSFIATKTATPLIDVPQAISYVTKEVIEDQKAFRTSEVLKNISGVNQFSAYDDYTLRGFRSSTQLMNGLKVVGSGWTPPLTANLERVEVIKGPASAMFGNTDPGGTINRVTKKPLEESRKSIQFSTGSFNTVRALADFTGPMNDEKTLLYRLNMGYGTTESYRNLQGSQSFIVAPSISFIPNEKTSVNADLVYSGFRGKLDRGQPIFGATAGTDLTSTPIEFAIGKTNDYQNEDFLNLTTSLTHKFTEDLTFNLSYLKSVYTENLMEHRTSNDYAVDSLGQPIPTLMGMQMIRRMQTSYADNISTYFTYNLDFEPIKQTILLGYDFNQQVTPIGGSSMNARGYRNASNTGSHRNYNPNRPQDYLYENGIPVPNIPHFNLEDPQYTIADITNYHTTSSPIDPSRFYTHGIYIQDQIKIDRLQVLLGLRKEFYYDLYSYKQENEETIRQESLIPRVGVVYNVFDNINFYATYVEGFQPQSASLLQDTARYGGPFDPLVSKMYEGGFKGEFFQRKLMASVAVYQIEQNNILVNAEVSGYPDRLRQRGQEVAQGVELDVVGKIADNFSITANYAYNYTIITESDDESEIGRIKENAPKHQSGIWAKYTLKRGEFKGIGIGLGSYYVSERNTMDVELDLPSYLLFDAALYYTVDKFTISLNMYNLTDEIYWPGGYNYVRLFPGAPRNFLTSVSYTF